jgi:hypothetical protein
VEQDENLTILASPDRDERSPAGVGDTRIRPGRSAAGTILAL